MSAFKSNSVGGQHILPEFCIARFANDRNQLRVNFLDGSVKWLATDAPLFQTENNWPKEDQAGWMQRIESSYYEIFEQVLYMQEDLDRDDCDVVTRFFLLWRYRYRYSIYGFGSVTPDLPSPAEAKKLETKSGRQLIEEETAKQHIRWSSYHYKKSNLFVPDCPPDVAYLPVTPKVALIATMSDKPPPEALNLLVKSTAKRFYFRHQKFIPRC